MLPNVKKHRKYKNQHTPVNTALLSTTTNCYALTDEPDRDLLCLLCRELRRRLLPLSDMSLLLEYEFSFLCCLLTSRLLSRL